jgi:hypothetical protein
MHCLIVVLFVAVVVLLLPLLLSAACQLLPTLVGSLNLHPCKKGFKKASITILMVIVSLGGAPIEQILPMLQHTPPHSLYGSIMRICSKGTSFLKSLPKKE